MKADFTHAKRLANLPTSKRADRHDILKRDAPLVDPEMLYKALGGGRDPIMKETKCGFDHVQLEKLFPEEMRAFQRWKEVSLSLDLVCCSCCACVRWKDAFLDCDINLEKCVCVFFLERCIKPIRRAKIATL